jgi:dienelactone hydrolase
VKALLALLVAALVAIPAADAYRNPTPGRALVLQIPGMHRAKVRRNVVYRSSPRLRMDVYRPRRARGRLPAVLLGGPPGNGRGSGQKIGWAQLIAASGLAAVAFDIRSQQAASDVQAAITHVRAHAARLGIDRGRLCTLGFSAGSAPWQLWATMRDPQAWLRCNVVYYGPLDFRSPEYSAMTYLDRHGGRIPPMLVVKAGRDRTAGVNDSIDRFEAEARQLHADLRVVTNAAARQRFDLGPRTARSRAIVRQTLRYLRARLARPLRVTEGCVSATERASALRFFDSVDTPLVGVALGGGPSGLVLAHMIGSDLCEWLPYARGLAASGYRVLAYDTRSNMHVDREAAAAVEALRRTGTERVVLAGGSLGALAAIVGGAALPEPPAAVVSLSSPSSFGRLDGLAAVRRLRSPVFFAASEADSAFADDARTLYAAAASAERRLEILPGSAHGVAMLEDASFLSRFRAFVADHLR